jgi:DNA replication and repair protein RecF
LSERVTAPRLALEALQARHFRNLTRADLTLEPGLNVLSGANGAGKTSLLEAIYFVATSRSFRTSKLAEITQHAAEAMFVEARFRDGTGGIVRQQTAALSARRVQVRIDGNRPARLSDYATRSPVVVFHPGELALSTGPAGMRRTLLDRVALFLDPGFVEHRLRYGLAIRERQAALQSRRGSDAALDAFEALCAEHGAHVTKARTGALELLAGPLDEAFRRIADPALRLEATYAPGGTSDIPTALRALFDGRPRDAHRPTPGFGPHRDDLSLQLQGHAARRVASQGQHRAITLALKAAEARAIRAARGVEPLLLLDDVSSELDADRTAAFFEYLRWAEGQIVLTTTRPELVVTSKDAPRADFLVLGGGVERVAEAASKET